MTMPSKKCHSVVYIFGALLFAVFYIFPAQAHNGEDAYSAPAVPQANVPMELAAGAVVRMVVENMVTNVTTQYVSLRGDDGQRVTLNGKGLEALPTGARAEAIGWRNGATFAVSDFRIVAASKAQTANIQTTSILQVEGALLLAHLDFFDSGRGEYLYMVRDDAGHVTRLNLAPVDGLEPGMRIIVRGALSADGASLDVDVLTITAKPTAQGQPVGEAATHNVLAILVKFTDSPASDPFTQAQVQQVMTSATNSVEHYYEEVSYSQQMLNVTVTNWLVGRDPSTHATRATPPSCDFNTVGAYANTAATDAGYTGIYQNRFYIMPSNPACGGWIGLAYIGGSTAWSNGRNQLSVFAHELGHNFGLYHAASLQCAGGASIGGTCSSTEYGDPFDAMGNISAMHFNTAQKSKLSWIPASSVKTHGSGFQQYTLDVLENGGGTTYAVKIPIAANANRTYWIEYRQPLGFDTGLSASSANGVQIRVANPFETCTGCLWYSDDTELLDMTATTSPGNFNDAVLAVGQTFTDSTYGITVQALSKSATQLVLNVTTPGGSPTTTTLVSSPNPSTAGTSVTFTATVTGNTPTGTVQFTDGGTTITGCAAVALTGAGNTRTAACSIAALAVGTHSIVAAYSGDGSNGASNSPPLSQIVNSKPPTTTSVVTSLNPSNVGMGVTFTASVTGSAPTGTVNFTDGGATISGCGTVALTGAGNTRTAACSTSALAVGTRSIAAAYGGDAGNAASSSAPLSQVVNLGSSTTALSSSSNPSVVGTSVTFTASVTGNAPTGTINFTDGGTTIGGCGAVALTGAGNTRTAACSTSALSVGTRTIAAAYAGDAGNAASSSISLSQVVNPASSTTTLSSSANPSIVGAGVTFTTSVTGNAPTGTVNFTDGGTTIAGCGAVALSGAGNTRTAACSTSALSVGTRSIVATYAGNTSNTASSSTPLSQVVNPASSTTTLSSSANPSIVGASVTFTASVTGNAPTGTVNFTDGGTTIAGCGAVALSGAGNTRTAACSTSALSVGTRSIVATYAGNTSNTASSSTPLSQVVNPASSTAALSSSANPSIVGAGVTFTASVTGNAPTGTVNFTNGGTTIGGCGAVALSGAGNTRTAACSTLALNVGTRSIVATYAGNTGNIASSSTPLSQVVNPASSTTTLSSSANPAVVGASITFTASLTGHAPTGTVNFKDAGTTISGCGTVALSGAGNTRTAACSTSGLSLGTHSVIASYSGDGANTASSSGLLSQSVAGSTPAVTKVSSRRVHGSAGTFDLRLSAVPTNPTTEPRQGPVHTIVFTFNKPITAATVAVTGGTATAGAPTFSGNDVIVVLTAVTNAQYVTIALSNVASADGGTGGTGSVRIGFLAGDVSQNRVVTVADLGLVNAVLARPVIAANYLNDINASGTLTIADKAIAIAKLSTALPAP